MTPATQDLLTLLINTRTLLHHVYPELFGLPADDLRALKERLARAAAGTARPAAGRAANALPALAPTAAPWAALAQSISAAAPACSNMALEDAVHRIMLDARKVSTWTYGAPEPWHQLLRDYPVNALTSVVVDGVPVQWLAWTTLAAIYSDRRDDVAATNWHCVALDNMTGVNNPVRLADLCVGVSRVHLRRSMRNLARVKDFAQLAVELAPSNTRVRIDALDNQAGAALLAGTPRERIAILRDLVARGGCTPRQAVYERLARDYFRTGEPRAAVAALFTCLRRCVIKLEEGRFNHFIEALRCARSVLTAGELEQLHALLRGSALRYPATLADVASSSKALALAQAPWLEEHLRLARIEEAGVFSDADWLFISNSVARRPSARAGRLWIKAQVAHVTTATNSIDWSGWIAGWNAVPSECEGPAGLGDTGVRNLLYADLLGVLERYEEHVDRNGTAPNGINCALQHLFGVPHAGALYERAYQIVAQWDAYLQFDFLMHRVYSKATLAADDADLARLRRLQPNMREGWGGIWRDHLLQRANEDSAASNQWLELVKMLPAAPPAPPRP